MSRPARSTLPSALTLILGVLIGLASAWSYKLIQEPESPSALELGPQGATAHSPAEPPPSEVTPAQEAREDRKETSPAPAASASAAPPARVPPTWPMPHLRPRDRRERRALPRRHGLRPRRSRPSRRGLPRLARRSPGRRAAPPSIEPMPVSHEPEPGPTKSLACSLQSYEITGKAENRILQLSGGSLEKLKISSQELSRASQSVEVNFVAVLGAGLLLKDPWTRR
jgi:hypothetical protein